MTVQHRLQLCFASRLCYLRCSRPLESFRDIHTGSKQLVKVNALITYTQNTSITNINSYSIFTGDSSKWALVQTICVLITTAVININLVSWCFANMNQVHANNWMAGSITLLQTNTHTADILSSISSVYLFTYDILNYKAS